MASQTKELEKVYLTDDLVEGILVRLPAESLVKFKVVCKLWSALITSRQFVNRHLQVTINDKKNTSSVSLLTWTQFYFPSQKLSLLNIFCSDEHGISNIPCSIVEPDLPLSLRMAAPGYGNVAVRHCNGIISIVFHLLPDRTVDMFPKTVLCNPILKELRVLPKHFKTEKSWLVGGGFGYDSTTADYKVVRLYSDLLGDEREVWVYTLRTDSWRMAGLCKIGVHIFEDKGLYCRDAHYWLPSGVGQYQFHIDAFDYSTEAFHVIPLPKFPSEISYRLAKWKDSVVLFTENENSEAGKEIEMWVMVGRFGGSDAGTSWTRHLEIRPLNDIYSPLVFWKDDELLLISNEGRIISYNLDTKDCRTVPHNLDAVRFLHEVEPCVGSLVSVRRE